MSKEGGKRGADRGEKSKVSASVRRKREEEVAMGVRVAISAHSDYWDCSRILAFYGFFALTSRSFYGAVCQASNRGVPRHHLEGLGFAYQSDLQFCPLFSFHF